MFGKCGGMAQSNANLEVEEICTKTNSPYMPCRPRNALAPARRQDVRPNRRNSWSSYGRRTLGICACSIRGVEGRARDRSRGAQMAQPSCWAQQHGMHHNQSWVMQRQLADARSSANRRHDFYCNGLHMHSSCT